LINKRKKCQTKNPPLFLSTGWAVISVSSKNILPAHPELLLNSIRTFFCLRRPGGSFEKPPPGPLQNFLFGYVSFKSTALEKVEKVPEKNPPLLCSSYHCHTIYNPETSNRIFSGRISLFILIKGVLEVL
jgi:hypothetical protein